MSETELPSLAFYQPYAKIPPEEQKELAHHMGIHYDNGASVPDLSYLTGISEPKVRRLLKSNGTATRNPKRKSTDA